jgi:hypothetical protein
MTEHDGPLSYQTASQLGHIVCQGNAVIFIAGGGGGRRKV